MEEYQIENTCIKCNGTGKAGTGRGCLVLFLGFIFVFLSLLFFAANIINSITRLFFTKSEDLFMYSLLLSVAISTFLPALIYSKFFSKCDYCKGTGKTISVFKKIRSE